MPASVTVEGGGYGSDHDRLSNAFLKPPVISPFSPFPSIPR